MGQKIDLKKCTVLLLYITYTDYFKIYYA